MTNFGIGDAIIRMKNASMVGKATVEFPKFKFIIAVLEVLKRTKFVVDYEILGRKINVTLRYDEQAMPLIQNVKLLSKPGRRWYIKVEDIRPVRSGTGIMIISTPKGVMTTGEAKKANVGGELICEIW